MYETSSRLGTSTLFVSTKSSEDLNVFYGVDSPRLLPSTISSPLLSRPLTFPIHPRTNTYRTKLVLRCVAEAGVLPRGNTSDFLKTQTVLTAHPLFSWKYVLSFVKKSYTLYEESCVRVITSATLIDNTRVRQFHFANPIIVQCSIWLLY